MKQKMKKEVYEKPIVEVIEFKVEESIAASGGAGYFEELY